MSNPRAYEVYVRVRLRVLACDEDGARRIVSSDAAERLTAVLEELHRADARLSSFCVHADELVEELE